jgi:RNA polymerase sigma-70 factor (ECF subfamily)
VAENTWEAFRQTAMLGRPAADVASDLNMPVASVFKAKSNVQKMLQDELKQMEMSEA